MKKIFIDPGHGGTDPGAIGHIIEKEFNLLIAKNVIEKLKEYSCEVYTSRTTDTTVSLGDRVALSNKNKCDVFVSIHCNSAESKAATGFESFSYTGNSTLQKNVHNEIMKGLKLKDRGMKSSNFYVLKNTSSKAILIELGFVNNAEDCRVLKSSVSKIVDGIVRGIVKELGLSHTTSTREVYRVCVGSYTIKENADNMKRQLEKEGYKVDIYKATI